MKRVKILDFIVSGFISYTKISRMVIFGLTLLLYFLKLSVGNGFQMVFGFWVMSNYSFDDICTTLVIGGE